MVKITQEDFIEIHKCSLFQESNPILIARKINSIGTNAIANKAIDDLLNTTIRLEVQNNTLPIGNGKLLDLTDAAACRDFFNQIVANVDLEDANLDVAQKIKVVINEVYKGAGNVPFPEAIFDN